MNSGAAHDDGRARLDEAYDRLERHAPDRLARMIRWLRNPQGRWVRLPLGLLIVAASLLGPVLPIIGIELMPIGLLLLAQDFPPLRKPVANLTLWLERKYVEWKARRQERQRRRQAQQRLT